MTEYRCLVVTPQGRENWRVIEAGSQDGAIARLLSDGLTPLEVRTGALSIRDRLDQPVRLSFGPGLAEQALILTQLAMLVRAGLPVDRSLDLLRDQSPKAAQRELLGQALQSVREGSGLAKALEERGLFPEYVIGVLRSAEQSGRLGDALASIAERMTIASATRRQLVTALTYPAAVLMATIVALVLVLTIVVPQFEPVFAGQEDRLPSLTRLVLALSAGVRDHGVIVPVAILALVLLARLFLGSDAGARLMDRFRDRIPGLALRDQYLASQFAGMLATLLANGVTVVRALPLARSAIGSRRWKRHVEAVERSVREGRSLSGALMTGSLVPRTAIRLIEVGERSGELADTCLKASTIMGEGARARIERLVSLANPIAIVSLGGIVALLVAGVMLGIFALGDFAG